LQALRCSFPQQFAGDDRIGKRGALNRRDHVSNCMSADTMTAHSRRTAIKAADAVGGI
jgi:hypothetical protein